MGDMLELGPESASFHHRAVAAVFDAGIEILVAVGPATTEAVGAINQTGVVHRGVRPRAGARIPSRTEPPVGPTGPVRPTYRSVTEQTGKPASQQVFLCEDAAAANEILKSVLAPGDTVWIKGSRTVGLDRVVRELEARFAHPEPRALARADVRSG